MGPTCFARPDSSNVGDHLQPCGVIGRARGDQGSFARSVDFTSGSAAKQMVRRLAPHPGSQPRLRGGERGGFPVNELVGLLGGWGGCWLLGCWGDRLLAVMSVLGLVNTPQKPPSAKKEHRRLQCLSYPLHGCPQNKPGTKKEHQRIQCLGDLLPCLPPPKKTSNKKEVPAARSRRKSSNRAGGLAAASTEQPQKPIRKPTGRAELKRRGKS